MDIYSSGIQPHKIYTVEQSVGARGDVTARTCILEIIRGKVIRTSPLCEVRGGRWSLVVLCDMSVLIFSDILASVQFLVACGKLVLHVLFRCEQQQWLTCCWLRAVVRCFQIQTAVVVDMLLTACGGVLFSDTNSSGGDDPPQGNSGVSGQEPSWRQAAAGLQWCFSGVYWVVWALGSNASLVQIWWCRLHAVLLVW